MLGMGTNIKSSRGLPSLEKDGKVPKLDESFVEMILEADGFAEVCTCACACEVCCEE